MVQSQLPKKKILILSANPEGTDRLRLDREEREIRESLQMGTNRDNFNIVSQPAVRTKDIQRIMLTEKPQIVHFSGHGAAKDGLVFEDINGRAKQVPTKALAQLFGLCANHVECVVLNACYSVIQARCISKYIGYVVGMRQEVGDTAAIEYSRGFYLAIASGEPYDIAHDYGRNAIQIEDLGEDMTPIIKKKIWINFSD
ncbi:MAG TPA: CHAT domain-containing protein [Oscillatoriaceae cyanobacterium M33_DOE_052]|uniref:CHAT domain-containing protein n=1 Tax=Planktothricoides sp. SpSt-374 TaxID=2282167 RepID=A0A7C3ZMR5_9CYAN|nr:CHAT domain-containing protein [Oscillatoriaceae cyanobacterium M33_DOE_052]